MSSSRIPIVACFAYGTNIATPGGSKAAEDLSIGEHVCTADGGVRSVRWIGHRSYDGRFIAGNRDVLPIVVQAGAIGEGLPLRDLTLSPPHGLAMDGVLIPVRALVNGATIRQLPRVERIDYCHVELDAHDVLLAEGLPAESFVPTLGRAMFQNADAYDWLLDQDPPPVLCAPRVSSGPVVDAVRARIAARAAVMPPLPEPAAPPDLIDEPLRSLPPRLVSGGLPRGQPGRRRRALVIVDRLPRPFIDVGLMSHVLALRRLGFQVSIAPVDGVLDVSADADGNSVLAEAGIECLGSPRYRSVEEALRDTAGRFSLAYLYGARIARIYEPLVRAHGPATRVVFGAPELTHLRLLGQAALQEHPGLASQAAVLRQEELLAAYVCDATIVHSGSEAAALHAALPSVAVHVVPWALAALADAPSHCGRSGIGVVGPFHQEAELDAAIWLACTVMPRIWDVNPTIELMLGSMTVPDTIQKLAGPRITVMSSCWPVLDQVRMTVAPLRFSAGVHSPALHSLALGVPCAMTRHASDGLLMDGALSALVAEGEAGMANTILALYRERETHTACVTAGLDLVRRDWSEAAVDAAMRPVLTGTAERHRLH